MAADVSAGAAISAVPAGIGAAVPTAGRPGPPWGPAFTAIDQPTQPGGHHQQSDEEDEESHLTPPVR
jgi:hypothetical protein